MVRLVDYINKKGSQHAMFRNYDALDSLKVQIEKTTENSPKYKLKDIQNETWGKETAIESMILLVDEHNHRYGMSKLVAATVALILYMAIYSALQVDSVTMSVFISGIVIVVAAVFGTIATIHILKMKGIRKSIYNRVPGQLMVRGLSVPQKLIVAVSFILIGSIGVVYGLFFNTVKLVPEIFMIVFFWYMATGFKSASQYKFVLENAPYVLKEIERRDEQATANLKNK